MPFSICGTTVAELNTVHCWEDGYYNPSQTHVHKFLHSQNYLYSAHISSIWYGNFVLILNALMTGRVAVSWCCWFYIFLRTRITLLESGQLMQLPLSCLRKPVPFEAPRTTEHTGYLLYTDLLCFGWTMLNENTTQRVFAAYLPFWTTLKLNWNVWLSQTPSWNCLQWLARRPKPCQNTEVGQTDLKERSRRLVGR